MFPGSTTPYLGPLVGMGAVIIALIALVIAVIVWRRKDSNARQQRENSECCISQRNDNTTKRNDNTDYSSGYLHPTFEDIYNEADGYDIPTIPASPAIPAGVPAQDHQSRTPLPTVRMGARLPPPIPMVWMGAAPPPPLPMVRMDTPPPTGNYVGPLDGDNCYGEYGDDDVDGIYSSRSYESGLPAALPQQPQPPSSTNPVAIPQEPQTHPPRNPVPTLQEQQPRPFSPTDPVRMSQEDQPQTSLSRELTHTVTSDTDVSSSVISYDIVRTNP